MHHRVVGHFQHDFNNLVDLLQAQLVELGGTAGNLLGDKGRQRVGEQVAARGRRGVADAGRQGDFDIAVDARAEGQLKYVAAAIAVGFGSEFVFAQLDKAAVGVDGDDAESRRIQVIESICQRRCDQKVQQSLGNPLLGGGGSRGGGSRCADRQAVASRCRAAGTVATTSAATASQTGS